MGQERVVGYFILAVAVGLALASAREYAGCWNDGSRLATVECLVDRNTLAIDHSIFVEEPARTDPDPYPDDPELLRTGTLDKLFIGGRYYSDKSPVPALLMAGLYRALKAATGLTAEQDPDDFCYWMTIGSSGLAYVVAVWCVYQLGGALRLGPTPRLPLTAAFALATVAPAYARHVNNHILLLGVAGGLLLLLVRDAAARDRSRPRLLGIGMLAGLGYTIDLGVGPVLFACTLALVAFRRRRVGSVMVFVAAALPWLALHHAVNYAVGGTLGPANAVPEYFLWPGCPFTPDNLTGGWQHRTPDHFLVYAAALLFGKRGFLFHNLPLLLVLPAAVALWRRRPAEWPEVVFAFAWSVGTWLVYAMNSNNYSGRCCSIRWFVPLLMPGFYVVALFLRQYPGWLMDFRVLSAWGALLAGFMWWRGPWMRNMVPLYWPIVAAALVSWGLCRAGRWRGRQPLAMATEPLRVQEKVPAKC